MIGTWLFYLSHWEDIDTLCSIPVKQWEPHMGGINIANISEHLGIVSQISQPMLYLKV